MTQRKVWTPQQDEVLKKILGKGKKKWNTVAQIMQKQYKIYGRTGKQCRQRWHNQLDPKINNDNWTAQEQKTLFELHQKIGNKWAKISNHFKGRTDNAVKNHFYSTIRKAFRRLNRHLVQTKAQKNKQLKNIILTKLLSAAQDRFNKKLKLDEQVIRKSIQLKNRLIYLAKIIDQQKETVRQMDNLIEELHDFTKSWKRKKKKGKKTLDEFEDQEQGEDDQIQEQSSIQIKEVIKKIPSKIQKRNSIPKPLVTRLSSRISKKQSQIPKPLITRNSSKKQSLIQLNLQPKYSSRLRSNPSYFFADDNDPFFMKKRSSNYSIFGHSLFPRLSDIQFMPKASITFNQSQNNKSIKNIFENPQFTLQRLDQ